MMKHVSWFYLVGITVLYIGQSTQDCISYIDDADALKRLIETTISQLPSIYNDFSAVDYGINSLDPLTASYGFSTTIGDISSFGFCLNVSNVYATDLSTMVLSDREMVYNDTMNTMTFCLVAAKANLHGDYELKAYSNSEIVVSGNGEFTLEIGEWEMEIQIQLVKDPIPVIFSYFDVKRGDKLVSYNMEGMEDFSNDAEIKRHVVQDYVVPILRKNYVPDLTHRVAMLLQEIFNSKLSWTSGANAV